MPSSPPDVLFHFSEDPTIAVFAPHVPATNPTQPPAVWAIDAEHAPLYWFPRDCPRVTVWAADGPSESFGRQFHTRATRLHAVEAGWLARVRECALYRYTFAAGPFSRWPEADGQWTTTERVQAQVVEPVGDLLALHAAAGIELRLVPDLWPLHDVVAGGQWPFSIVRMRNAQPRRA